MDRETFNREVISLDRRMYAVAMTIMRDADDAADIVQETMVSLWESRDRLDSIDNLAAYCMTAVRRKCLDKIKSFHASQFVEMPDSLQPTEFSPDPAQAIEDRQELRLAVELMKQLPDNQRRVLTLSALRSLSNIEIAEMTRLSEQNVRTLLCRARQKIKQLYLRQYKGLSPC